MTCVLGAGVIQNNVAVVIFYNRIQLGSDILPAVCDGGIGGV